MQNKSYIKAVKIIVISILFLIVSGIGTYQICKETGFNETCIQKISETFEKAEVVEKNIDEGIEIIENNAGELNFEQ